MTFKEILKAFRKELAVDEIVDEELSITEDMRSLWVDKATLQYIKNSIRGEK